MRITASELREQIVALDWLLVAERALLLEQRAKIRDLRQSRELKVALLRKIEEQGLDSIEVPL